MSSPDPDGGSPDRGVRKWVASISICGTIVMFGVLGYFTYVSNDPSRAWMRKIIVDHPSATIGIPICAVIASSIVLLFNATSGPINFEIPGVKLQGGSGPAIVWVITFFSIVYGMKLLWNP
jgi:hypothetical protein